MRVVIAGGGTGGHLFPGIALAREFQRRSPETQVIFVGTKQGLEGKVLSREGFRLKTIICRALVGMGLIRRLGAILLLPVGVIQSLLILSRFKPDIVLGLGGYSSGPVILAGRLLRMAIALCEQNLTSGLTNRVLSRFADKVFVSFPETVSAFPPGKAVHTGNPVRAEVVGAGYRREGGDKLNLLILGGSRGASSINSAMMQAIPRLRPLKPSLQIIHQTGQEDFPWVSRRYQEEGFNAIVRPFFEEIDLVYREADIVVARSGATTISEICAVGIPAILIPYPFAAGDHQRINAKRLERDGAALVIEPERLKGDTLADAILRLLKDREGRRRMAERARALSRPEAAKVIVDICYQMVGKRWLKEIVNQKGV